VLRIWLYEKAFDETLAHVYTYDEESNWTTFCPGGGPNGALSDPCAPWTCPADCFVRVTAQVPAGSAPETLADVAAIHAKEAELPVLSEGIRAEIDAVCSRVDALREQDDLALIVLSDVHYSTGCIWPETARNIAEVAARIHPDAIVQLGDLSDGVAPIRVTLSYAERVLSDLHRCGAPVYGCVGNHDVNYFKGNDELLSAHDCALLYTGRDEPWYYEDFPKAQVRCFFLQSFDPLREQRYGYAAEEVEWLRQELQELPSGWSALCFSHLPLYADIHYWSDSILNEASLSEALECFNRQRPGAILGFIHGHSHVDQVFRRHSFPDISIGCAKFEDFQECKPQGSSTPVRRKGDASQDLWNVLIVKRREGRLELVRFGAGDDMSITSFAEPPRDRRGVLGHMVQTLHETPIYLGLRHMPVKRFLHRLFGGRA
jgi:hypothetical protein